ncbi:hypothetical protein PAT3040_03158 [Paenibacillus agaridevorans]|uniref:Uncharacterized protein n=1 Tax=Paenibacillus agaridevorans TaxID=171404 RepID=A0A2R5EPF2_9BACL|nr:hypothetical protein PAT3040_03158 [Paenibacillus agaridevorans]
MFIKSNYSFNTSLTYNKYDSCMQDKKPNGGKSNESNQIRSPHRHAHERTAHGRAVRQIQSGG